MPIGIELITSLPPTQYGIPFITLTLNLGYKGYIYSLFARFQLEIPSLRVKFKSDIDHSWIRIKYLHSDHLTVGGWESSYG